MTDSEVTTKKSGKKSSRFKRGNRYRYKPGQCGNKNGRPRTAKFSEAAREFLAETDPRKKLSIAEDLVRDCVKRAKRGSVKHLEIILDRTEGKVAQRNEFSGPSGSTIPISLEAVDARLADLLGRASRPGDSHAGGKS